MDKLMTYDQKFTIGIYLPGPDGAASARASVTGIVDLSGYGQVCLELVVGPGAPNITTFPSVIVTMGCWNGSLWTVGEQIDSFELNGPAKIRVYSVIGPQLEVVVQGYPGLPPNTQMPVRGWVLLR